MTRQEIEKYILKTYGSVAEYPWNTAPKYAVYRHEDNRKWFAVVMDIPKRKLGIDSDEIVDIMNVKCDPILVASLLSEEGFFPAYHMVKGKWITIMLDSVDDKRIKWLLGMSFELTMKK
ncbi:MAG: MmcQ/YjbR family DNA-binding protein [Ruminococcaceae bacterium]|nr:MmcQ/YjbR family DNA-binding protein [Oscillospiraceae bacterium]